MVELGEKKSNAPIPTMDIEAHVADRYDIKRRLGKGAYGIVWKAMLDFS